MIDRFQNWLFPELRRFDSRVSGRRALQVARSESMRTRRMMLFTVMAVPVMTAANLGIKHLVAPRVPILDYARDLIFPVALLVFVFFHSRESRHSLR